MHACLWTQTLIFCAAHLSTIMTSKSLPSTSHRGLNTSRSGSESWKWLKIVRCKVVQYGLKSSGYCAGQQNGTYSSTLVTLNQITSVETGILIQWMYRYTIVKPIENYFLIFSGSEIQFLLLQCEISVTVLKTKLVHDP